MPCSQYTEDMNMNYKLHDCHDLSSYPCATVAGGMHLSMAHEAGLRAPSIPYADIPETYFGGRSAQAINMNKVYSQTYMYICCQCGDGPKVYNVQPRCTECEHVICSSCRPVK